MFQPPTLAELQTRVLGDVAARSKGQSLLRFSLERVLGHVLAGLAYGLHGHLAWLRSEMLPTTCSEASLLAWGSLLKVTRKAAVASQHTFRFDSAGPVPPAGAQVTGPNGLTYTVFGVGTFVAPFAYSTATCDVPGAVGNLAPGAEVVLASPVSGVLSAGSVYGPSNVAGVDAELLEPYRARVCDNLRTPPGGGSVGDYRAWALAVGGVSRAWEVPHRYGVGTMAVFVANDTGPCSGPVVTAAQAAVPLAAPVDTGGIYVGTPIAKPVNVTVALKPNTATTQAQVAAELASYFATTTFEQTEQSSAVVAAVGRASGVVAFTASTTSMVCTPGGAELLTLGTVTFATLS